MTDFSAIEPDDYVLTFTPVPSRRVAAGWSERRQRTFILLLRLYGTAATAARAVGLSYQSAYKLRSRADATEFADAWDRAIDEARARAFDLAMQRGVHGTEVPVFYQGRYAGTRHSYDTRLALAALSYADRLGATEAKGER